MIFLTQQEHNASRERVKEREPPRTAARQLFDRHMLLRDGHHLLRKEHPEGKSIARTTERGRAVAGRPVIVGLPAAMRDEETSAATPDGNLFRMLIERDTTAFPSVLHVAAHIVPTPSPTATQKNAGAPMALWQSLENELDRVLINPLNGPVSVTLLLPHLGDVDARMQALPAGGWDIALRLSPTALDALATHEERYRNSLRRRLACRVRLRFELRREHT